MDSAHISSLKFTIMAVMLILVVAAVSQAQQLKLLPDDGAPYEQFGNSVSIHGDVAAIRTSPDDDEGSIYIFRRAISGWVQEAKISTFDTFGFDYNNSSVAVYGDFVVFGEPFYGDYGHRTGAAHVYRYDGANWVQDALLIGDDIDAYRGFGASVAIPWKHDRHRRYHWVAGHARQWRGICVPTRQLDMGA